MKKNHIAHSGKRLAVLLLGAAIVTGASVFTATAGPGTPDARPESVPEYRAVANLSAADTSIVDADTAKAAALSHAGISADQARFIRAELEWDDGLWRYDVEFHTDDYREYDYEIDAVTGDILKFDYEAESYHHQAESSGRQIKSHHRRAESSDRQTNLAADTGTGKTLIGESQAESIALAAVSGADASHVKKVRLDRDDGRQMYEVDIIYNLREYEFEIDAYSGAILSSESESIFD